MDETSAAFTIGLWAGRLFIVAVGLGLLALGLHRKRSGRSAGGWIAAGILVALLGVTTTALQVVDEKTRDEAAGPPAVEDTSVPQVFGTCEEAASALQSSLDQLVVEGEAGRVDAMRSATFTMLRIPGDNPTCFDPAIVEEFAKVSATDPDNEGLDYSRIDEECWLVARDAATIKNFASGFGQAVPQQAERVLAGLTVLSTNEPACLSADDATEMAEDARAAWG